MSRIWKTYLNCLSNYPLQSKIATGLVITGSGDLIAQLLIEGRQDIDRRRLFNFCVYGCLFTGCFNHFYFRALDRFFGADLTAVTAVKKVAIDLGVLGPIELGLFMAWTHFGTAKESSFYAKLKQDYLEALIAATCLWGPAQSINFRLVPEHLRVLYVSTVNLIWYSYGSYISHKEVKSSSHQ